MKLRGREYCPIHRSVRCCGREPTHYARRLQLGFDALMTVAATDEIKARLEPRRFEMTVTLFASLI
jgi:hypothetical protein